MPKGRRLFSANHHKIQLSLNTSYDHKLANGNWSTVLLWWSDLIYLYQNHFQKIDINTLVLLLLTFSSNRLQIVIMQICIESYWGEVIFTSVSKNIFIYMLTCLSLRILILSTLVISIFLYFIRVLAKVQSQIKIRRS